MQRTAEAPRKLGSYRVGKCIGRGGMATVYKARHDLTGEIVALKIAVQHLTMSPTAVRRFEREFAVAHELSHPNLVRALECGEANGVLFHALEFVPGRNLQARIEEDGPLPLDDAVAIFSQVTEGLRYLHARNIVHRDIKPANIFLRENGLAKLGDFGLLKRFAIDSPLTQSREALGTMEFGAPEQFENAKGVDRRCDLFSLAASFYSAVTGKFPFGKGGNMKTLARKMQGLFVPLSQMVVDICPTLNNVINQSLDPKPARRPGNCEEFLAALHTQSHYLPDSAAAKTPSTSVTSPGKDRRGAARYRASVPSQCEPLMEKSRRTWQATVQNLSTNGLCLHANVAIAEDAILQVNLETPSRDWIPHLVRVKWVKTLPEQHWLLGCAFVKSLSAQALEEFYQPGALPLATIQTCRPID